MGYDKLFGELDRTIRYLAYRSGTTREEALGPAAEIVMDAIRRAERMPELPGCGLLSFCRAALYYKLPSALRKEQKVVKTPRGVELRRTDELLEGDAIATDSQLDLVQWVAHCIETLPARQRRAARAAMRGEPASRLDLVYAVETLASVARGPRSRLTSQQQRLRAILEAGGG